jgi:polyisoprenoid-binding protein YceI
VGDPRIYDVRDVMKKLVLLTACLSLFAEARQYEIKSSPDSLVQLWVEKTGFLSGKKHQFVFDRYQGSLQYDAEKPEASHIEFRVDAASASCKDTWLSPADLRKVQDYALKDMLAAERYPSIAFSGKEIKILGPNSFEVTGDLTIRDKTKPAVVTVSLKDLAGRLAFEGASRIRLTDYGLKPPSAALGTIGTKNEMRFQFLLLATPAP